MSKKDKLGIPLYIKIPVNYSMDQNSGCYTLDYDKMQDVFSDEMKTLQKGVNFMTSENYDLCLTLDQMLETLSEFGCEDVKSYRMSIKEIKNKLEERVE